MNRQYQYHYHHQKQYMLFILYIPHGLGLFSLPNELSKIVNLKSVSVISTFHAFGFSVLKEIQSDIIENDIGDLTHLNYLLDSSKYSTWIYSHSLHFIVLMASIYGYCLYMSPKSKFYKFQNIPSFAIEQKKINIVLLLFSLIFLRNIENAI